MSSIFNAVRRSTERRRKTRPITLMDMGTLAAKTLKKRGILRHLDESEEINACSVHIDADMDGGTEDWLLMFKNETHNHPTEIEPFGGAATCVGGAIRDPLSGRSLCLSGHARHRCRRSHRSHLNDTLPGKLPQQKAHHHRSGTAIPPTATRLVLPPAWCTSSIIPAIWQSAWRSARWSARLPLPM